MRPIAALAVLVGVLWGTRPAYGYDPRYTHRWITREAAQLLVEAYPGQYDELLSYIDAVAEGSQHEDDPVLDGDSDPRTMRVMRHFLHGTEGHGLTYQGREFPSSYEWAFGLAGDNQWSWPSGIEAYAAGDREHAYFVLGHAVHLIQDLTVPAHSHLDSHGPPDGDDFESYCTSQMMSEFESSLPRPAPGTPIPTFASAEEAWRATAAASYWRNMYPGDLSDPDRAHGVIAEMFPSLSWSWYSENWTIDEVGSLGSDFWEEEPGWFYFENCEHAAAVDYADYRPYAPDESAVDRNDAGATMVESFARDLVPIAILHSAAVMKLYLDEAHAAAPTGEGEPPVTDEPPPTGCRTSTPAPLVLIVLLPFFLARFRRNRCAR